MYYYFIRIRTYKYKSEVYCSLDFNVSILIASTWIKVQKTSNTQKALPCSSQSITAPPRIPREPLF